VSANVSRIWSAQIGSRLENCQNPVRLSPTVLQSGPYRFFFFSSDRHEPPHVHVKRDDKLAKFWLAPVRDAYNYGFSARELNRIAAITRENERSLREGLA
jgi:Domain of unknown function (DUF4160)